jgi:non-specific serine/threonine protein kinase
MRVACAPARDHTAPGLPARHNPYAHRVRRVAAAAIVLALVAGCSDDGPQRSRATTDWTPLRPATLERTEVGAVRIGRFVYVVGGFEREGARTTAAVERYDIRTDRWRRVRDMPIALNHSVAAAYRGDVYVMGGYTSATGLDTETAALLRYDPQSDRWRRLRRAPSPRAAHAMGVIGNRLYVAGGARDARPLRSMHVYSFRTRRWSRGPSMRFAREHLAGTVAGGRFYVLAGRAAGAGNFTYAERYDPRRRRWQRLPDMRKARGGIAAAAVGRRVVVFGGEESAGTIAEVELYDPARRRWSRLPDLRTPRHGLGGVSLGRRVYAIQGGPTPGYDFSSAIEFLDVRR